MVGNQMCKQRLDSESITFLTILPSGVDGLYLYSIILTILNIVPTNHIMPTNNGILYYLDGSI
jgi:hypothetical protein